MRKWLSDKHVAERYDASRATIWRWARNGTIPEPIKISPGCTRWDSERLDQYDALRESEAQREAA